MKTFEFLILHWKISVLTTNKIVDRLPGFWSLSRLGVPRLTPGKASEASAATAHEAIVAWNIADEVKRKCFDTTSVKSVPRNDACILLEQSWTRTILWCACHHHILETMLEAVVVLSLGPSKDPGLLNFKRLQSRWEAID